MKPKTWILLISSIVILGSYALFDFLSEKRTTAVQSQNAKLMSLKKDQIIEISIEKNGNSLLLKRGPDGWMIESPIQDWADNDAIDIFIGSMETEAILDTPAAGPSIDWALYGLDKPMARIELKSSSGENNVYFVSSKKNFEQKTFLRRGNEEKVHLVHGTWQARTEKGLNELRDMRMLRHKLGSITQVDFKTPLAHLLLRLVDGKWILPEKPGQKLDQSRVYTFLEMIRDTRAEKIIASGPLSSQEKSHYFLQSPMAELKLQLGDKNWSAIFGRDERRSEAKGKDKELFAWVNDPAFLLQIELGEVDKFFKVKVEDYFEQEKK